MSLVENNNLKNSLYDFDKTAQDYDSWYDTKAGRMYDKLEKKTFDRLIGADNVGKKLLDVGCGTGHWSSYFANKGFQVVGIDVSDKMIKAAKDKNIKNARFEVVGGDKIHFKDKSFDCAAAITSVEFMQNPQLAISEMVRCVKSKGIVLIGVLNSLNSQNKSRAAQKTSALACANLLKPQDIYNMLSIYGKPQVVVCANVSKIGWMINFAPVLDLFSNILKLKTGAFIAAKVVV